MHIRYYNWITGDKVTITKIGKRSIEYKKDEPNEIFIREGNYREQSEFCKPTYVFYQTYSKL